jgi:hypothetical protein
MAGTIIADYIRTDANKLSLNVGNTTIASINAGGFYSNTGTQIINQNGLVTLADGQITSIKLANNSIVVGKIDSTTIVGTVSQSGGLVTGSIIEKGTNSNGSYVKYADGTMICTAETPYVNKPSGATQLADSVRTFPATFAARPVAFANQFESHGDMDAGAPGITTNNNDGLTASTYRVGYRVFLTAQYQLKAQIVAVGRWY